MVALELRGADKTAVFDFLRTDAGMLGEVLNRLVREDCLAADHSAAFLDRSVSELLLLLMILVVRSLARVAFLATTTYYLLRSRHCVVCAGAVAGVGVGRCWWGLVVLPLVVMSCTCSSSTCFDCSWCLRGGISYLTQYFCRASSSL